MRKTSAALVIALALAGCGGGTDTEVPATTAPDTPITPFVGVANQADDVASAVNQRTADLEAQLNDATP